MEHERLPRASRSFLIRVVHFFSSAGCSVILRELVKKSLLQANIFDRFNSTSLSLSLSLSLSVSLDFLPFRVRLFPFQRGNGLKSSSRDAREHTDAEFHARARTKGGNMRRDATEKIALVRFQWPLRSPPASTFVPVSLCHSDLVKFRLAAKVRTLSLSFFFFLFFFFLKFVQTKLGSSRSDSECPVTFPRAISASRMLSATCSELEVSKHSCVSSAKFSTL